MSLLASNRAGGRVAAALGRWSRCLPELTGSFDQISSSIALRAIGSSLLRVSWSNNLVPFVNFTLLLGSTFSSLLADALVVQDCHGADPELVVVAYFRFSPCHVQSEGETTRLSPCL